MKTRKLLKNRLAVASSLLAAGNFLIVGDGDGRAARSVASSPGCTGTQSRPAQEHSSDGGDDVTNNNGQIKRLEKSNPVIMGTSWSELHVYT